VLKNLNVDHRRIRREIEKIIQHGPGGEQVVMGRLPHTPRAQKVIDYAIDEARQLKHNYIGTEHILLGLLREVEGVAGQVLIDLGLKLEDLRVEVLNLVGQTLPPGQSGPEIIKLEKSLNPKDAEAYGVSDFVPGEAPVQPEPLTEEQLHAVQHLIRSLTEQKQASITAQDFEQAARSREGIMALEQLLAWYNWSRLRR
jgi:ATP-dependent Clp protease ATP-binding subunit ClpA